MSCALCRSVFNIPEDGMHKLPRSSLVEQVMLTEAVHAVKCQLCATDRDASVYCVECCENMCAECKASHEKFPMLSGHEIIGLNEKKMFREPATLDQYSAKQPDGSCKQYLDSKHDRQQCKLCKVWVNAAVLKKKSINFMMTKLKTAVVDCQEQLAIISRKEKDLAMELYECKEQIESQCKKLQELKAENEKFKVRTRENDLQKELNDFKEKAQICIKARKSHVEFCLVLSKSLLEFVNKLMESESNVTVCLTADEVLARSAQVLETQRQLKEERNTKYSISFVMSADGRDSAAGIDIGSLSITGKELLFL